jgi:hypothetical protein
MAPKKIPLVEGDEENLSHTNMQVGNVGVF